MIEQLDAGRMGGTKAIRIDRESLLQLGRYKSIQVVADVVGRRYITVAEAAAYLQISDRTVRRLIRDGELNATAWAGLGELSGSTFATDRVFLTIVSPSRQAQLGVSDQGQIHR
jgi:excisionase family DNA binding protein